MSSYIHATIKRGLHVAKLNQSISIKNILKFIFFAKQVRMVSHE